MASIFIIEDDDELREIMTTFLQSEGYEIFSFSSCEEATAILKLHQPKLFILDIMLKKLSGLEFCTYLKEQKGGLTSEIPILLVTALTGHEDIIRGLDAGADDYVTKPFDLTILSARVRALLRRYDSKFAQSELLLFKNLTIEKKSRKVYLEGVDLNLTTMEFNILITLIDSAGKVLTRSELIRETLGEHISVTARTIDTHMVSLRKKVGEEWAKRIESVRGIGYRINNS